MNPNLIGAALWLAGLSGGLVACFPGASGQAATARCVTHEFVNFGPGTNTPALRPESVPMSVRSGADTVFSGSPLDLDCDGTQDFVGQVLASTSREASGKLFLVASVYRGGRWEEVLRAESPAAGPEVVALGKDLTGEGRLTLVTVAYDEGGYIPRVFRWSNGSYQLAGLSPTYFLRHEADWGPSCRAKINPRLIGNDAISLLRETIPRTSTKGHGSECALLRDTLRLSGDSLVVIHAPKG